MDPVLVIIALIVVGIIASIIRAQDQQDAARRVQTPAAAMESMETRLQIVHVGGEHPHVVQRVEARGLFPIKHPTNLAFAASILDETDVGPGGLSEMQPVNSILPRFQEPETTCFQDRAELGEVEPNFGWAKWTSVLNIIPETLVPARRGRRKLCVFINAFDVNNAPQLRHGFIKGKPLASWCHRFEWKFGGDGYLDQKDDHERAEELTVRVATAMAFADGGFHDAEGQVVKRWMSQRVKAVGDDTREVRRTQLNAALSDSFSAMKAGQLDLTRATDDLKAVASPAARIAAVELCLDVMAADRVVANAELKAVNAVAQRLEIDVERFENLKDKRLAGLVSNVSADVDFHALLNIDPSWDTDEITVHLGRLYTQWNSRAESLANPEQRAQAEGMLEVIAQARQSVVQ